MVTRNAKIQLQKGKTPIQECMRITWPGFESPSQVVYTTDYWPSFSRLEKYGSNKCIASRSVSIQQAIIGFNWTDASRACMHMRKDCVVYSHDDKYNSALPMRHIYDILRVHLCICDWRMSMMQAYDQQ